jgi:hypothetical protein
LVDVVSGFEKVALHFCLIPKIPHRQPSKKLLRIYQRRIAL